MSRETSRDVTINGLRFRIGLVSALAGDWIINQFLLRKYADEVTYKRVQTHLLGVVSLYTGDDPNLPPLKIYDGERCLVAAKFPEVATDPDLIHQLMDAALDLNFASFFARMKKESEEAEADRLADAATTR